MSSHQSINKNQTLQEDDFVLSEIQRSQNHLFSLIIKKYNSLLNRIGVCYLMSEDEIMKKMEQTYMNIYHSIRQNTHLRLRVELSKTMIHNCQTESRDNKKILIRYKNSEMRETIQPVDLKDLTFNQVIEMALSSLPLDYRLIYTLLEINRLDLDEVSEIVQKNESEVMEDLKLAKIHLQEEINQIIQPESLFEFNLIYCDKMVDRVMERIYHEEHK